VEVSLYDTSIMMTGFAALQHLFGGIEPRRNGNVSKDTVPTGVFHASDGPFYMVCGSTPFFRRLFRDVLKMPEIADDPNLAEVTGRLRVQEKLLSILNDTFGHDTRENWLNKLRAASVPASAVRTIPEALRSPETRSSGILTEVVHPTAGTVPNIALPLRLSGTPTVDPVAAPLHGADTRGVLSEKLGWSKEEFAAAEANGAFGPAL
jgi:crotonobetainyl-CoA:carnitine CoA-transferase CaiB-like acyl-CoA transferase